MMRKIYLNIFLLFLALTLGSSLTFGEEIKCDLCGKEIEGRYLKYRSKTQSRTVCLPCDRTKPHCAACNLPFHAQQLPFYKGERICRDCIKISKYCSFCDKRIQGKYVDVKDTGEIFCQRCFNHSPKCSICKLPTHLNRLDKESGACWRCLPKLHRCKSCASYITGKYFKFQFSEGYYCENCKLGRDKCYICSVPVGNEFWRFPDGRAICNECNEKAIIKTKDIRKIMEDAEKLVKKYIGIEAKHPYELHIEQLNKHSSDEAHKAKLGKNSDSPLYGEELGLYRSKDGKSEIFLLYGLPAEILYETAAHEYAHAWQAENCHPQQSKELKEGFAQWVAAQILKAKGFEKTLARLEARTDSPYGTGYQLVKKLHERMGRKSLIEYLKNNKN